MNINKRYNELTGNGGGLQSQDSINASIPTPTENDYIKGYITRFFAQKVNDKSAPIFEVSDVEFSSLNSNALYNTTSLRWRITGPINSVIGSNGIVKDMGIRESNKMSTKLASNIITNLKLYLPNLVQFSKSDNI